MSGRKSAGLWGAGRGAGNACNVQCGHSTRRHMRLAPLAHPPSTGTPQRALLCPAAMNAKPVQTSFMDELSSARAKSASASSPGGAHRVRRVRGCNVDVFWFGAPCTLRRRRQPPRNAHETHALSAAVYGVRMLSALAGLGVSTIAVFGFFMADNLVRAKLSGGGGGWRHCPRFHSSGAARRLCLACTGRRLQSLASLSA